MSKRNNTQSIAILDVVHALGVFLQTFMFAMTAGDGPTVPLPLASLTPMTPDWTGQSFSRVRLISKSKKLKSSRLQPKQHIAQIFVFSASRSKK
jgi:hypothetical protein